MKNHLKLNKRVLLTLFISMSCTIFGMQDADDQLSTAIGYRDFNGVRDALAAGANVNARSTITNGTPLMGAVGSGANTNLVELLLQNGADVNAVNKYGFTALMLAADKGRLDIVNLLLLNGANVSVKKRDKINNMTALERATVKGYTDVANRLREAMRHREEFERHELEAELL